jgi:hypothetical protein
MVLGQRIKTLNSKDPVSGKMGLGGTGRTSEQEGTA